MASNTVARTRKQIDAIFKGEDDRLALVVGSGRYHDEVVPLIGGLRKQVERLQLVFLDASTKVLVRRYESSRRRHPFAEA